MADVDHRLLVNRLNGHTRDRLLAAAGAAMGRGHYHITVEHLLLTLLDDAHGDMAQLASHFDLDAAKIKRPLDAELDRDRSGNTERPTFHPRLVDLLQSGFLMASLEMGLGATRSAALVAALAQSPGRFLAAEVDELAKINVDEFKKNWRKILGGSGEDEPAAAGAAGGSAAGGEALARFTTNFTANAKAGKVDPVFGRDAEIRQAIDILARRRKNNPIVVGDAGVGKTAIVEGLALRIAEGDVPDFLKNVEIFGLDMGLLQAGASVKGEFENRLKGVIEEVRARGRGAILFIDEAHTLIGAGGAAGTGDAANLLKPALARGELRTIGATTWMEYKKYFEEDPALARRFQPVKVDEPSPEVAAVMLRGLKEKYEKAHGVTVREDAILAAATLSARYVGGRQLPDKAVDVLDTAAARVRIAQSSKPGAVEDVERKIQDVERAIAALERDAAGGAVVEAGAVEARRAELETLRGRLAEETERWNRERAAVERVVAARGAAAAEGAAPETRGALDEALAALKETQGKTPLIPLEVDPDVVAKVVADWTGVPVGRMVGDEAARLLSLGEELKKRIKGQDHAVEELAESLRAAKTGLRDPEKPLGVFLLVGPSGVGKTETALAVADALFGGERFLVSINMSEYQDREMGISGLVGAKPGYVGYGKGGTLTEAVRQRPYSVVLLDEIEKACPEVRNLFFQVFDKGELTDGTGRTIDFRNTAIFICSNLASAAIQELALRSENPDPKAILERVRPELSRALQPAWLARCRVVPFLPLRGEALASIVALKLAKLAKRLETGHKLAVTIDEAVHQQIADRCLEVETGARNIDFILQGTLLPLLSREILARAASGRPASSLVVGLDEAGEFRVELN